MIQSVEELSQIDFHRTVFTGTAIRFEQPLMIKQVSKTCESQLRRTFRQLGYQPVEKAGQLTWTEYEFALSCSGS